MAQNVSRELPDSTASRRSTTDILPHDEERDPWIPSSELRRIVREAPADAALLVDLADVRDTELDGRVSI